MIIVVYLVIGGCGFIGSHLVRKLINLKKDVVIIDNLLTGYNSYERIRPIREKIQNAFFMDINTTELPKVDNLEGIYHLGNPSSTIYYRKNNLLTAYTTEGNIRVLKYAIENNCKVVFASTSSLYSRCDTFPSKETDVILPNDFYAETKLYCERLAKIYNETEGLSFVGLRLFSVYGEMEEYKGTTANLVSQFIISAIKNERPYIWGDGTQTRDFIYVWDVCDAFIKSMESKLDYAILNIGTGKETSLNELWRIIQSKTNCNLEPIYEPISLKNYVRRTYADISLAKQTIGFNPKYTLEEGIEKIIPYYKVSFGFQ